MSRTALLASLLDLHPDLAQTVRMLRSLPWDSEQALVVLGRAHVASVLSRYLERSITGGDVEGWADAIEGRDDIAYEVGYEGALTEVIFQLANPELTEALSESSAQKLLDLVR